jgi:hypothetical protein
MNHDNIIAHPELAAITATAGVAFGLLYFAALKRSVTLFVGGKNWFGPLALTLGRIAAAVSFLFFATTLGAEPLLGAFVGFLIARALALRANKRAG